MSHVLIKNKEILAEVGGGMYFLWLYARNENRCTPLCIFGVTKELAEI